jgi:hypothetical protein
MLPFSCSPVPLSLLAALLLHATPANLYTVHDKWGFGGQRPQQAQACAEGKGSEHASDPCLWHGQKLVCTTVSSILQIPSPHTIHRWGRLLLVLCLHVIA